MRLQEFIFSNKASHRVTRHLVFWGVYCTYFYLQSLPPQKFKDFFVMRTYFIALINACAFMPVIIITTYVLVYYLLPNTIQKKKYILFITGFLLIYVIGTGINYFTAESFLVITSHWSNTFQNRLEVSNYNTRWGMIIATIALGIKLSKNWYLQQKENLEIVRKCTKLEMQMQKARIHPEFLMRSLDTVYAHNQLGKDDTAKMILDLSDLLSYSLYESNMKLVTLERELSELQHLIVLEQINNENLVKINIRVEGAINKEQVAPMTFVKFLEEGTTALHKATRFDCLIDVQFTCINNILTACLSFTDVYKEALPNIQWSLLFENAKKRLREHYGSNFTIERTQTKNEISFKIALWLKDKVRESDESHFTNSVNEVQHDPT